MGNGSSSTSEGHGRKIAALVFTEVRVRYFRIVWDRKADDPRS
jgi:hypothetical protein